MYIYKWIKETMPAHNTTNNLFLHNIWGLEWLFLPHTSLKYWYSLQYVIMHRARYVGVTPLHIYVHVVTHKSAFMQVGVNKHLHQPYEWSGHWSLTHQIMIKRNNYSLRQWLQLQHCMGHGKHSKNTLKANKHPSKWRASVTSHHSRTAWSNLLNQH